jgi:hypothetical protein
MSDRHPVRRQTSQPARAADAQLNREVEAAERPIIAAAARVHGAAYVASSAMHHAVMLSRTADVAFRISPMGEDIYRAILMAYGSVATSEIQRLGLHGGGQR